ncbi:MAG: thiamine-phosphate kinase [Desulfocapsaceae bacterium]|jgi:thiamine-monophosphate kinase|nr:thiamine-phosphate kinase [Desulfocapsaceae bacterium]
MADSWRERDIIRFIQQASKKTYQGLVHGIGDDCAVIDPSAGEQLVVTTDMLVEDIHFLRDLHPPYELGRKSIAVNISDIAAMGGKPMYVFISVAIPVSIGKKWLQQWLSGVESIVSDYDCCLAGGDTVRGKNLTINVTLIGAVRHGQAVLRSTAGVGDSVFVSGRLGSAAAGLKLYQHFYGSELFAEPFTRPFKKRHLDPEPDVRCGMFLSECGLITSMQDISDGIATDLSHMCEASGVRGLVDASLLPYHPDLPALAAAMSVDMTELLVAGGEDYHLVFTVACGKDNELYQLAKARNIDIYRIGRITEGSGVFLESKNDAIAEITYSGFQH